MGRHGAAKAPPNDAFMATIVGVLILLLVLVVMLAMA
jgi:hypothetical protein